MLAPPVGLNVYVVNGMSPGVPIAESYRGVLPFLAADAGNLAGGASSRMLARRGFRIGEVPIIFVERSIGQSKLSSSVLIESLIMPWRLRLRSARPLPPPTRARS